MAEPTLYSYNGSDYSYNDLSEYLNPRVAEYIASQKRGQKDREAFYTAYSDLMNGIADHSIVFENGRFNDSKGRYRNYQWVDKDGKVQTTKDDSRDYYGLMAYFIQNGLAQQKKYESPEDKLKIAWSGTAPTRLFRDSVFGPDSKDAYSLKYFIDLDRDSDDPNSGWSTTKERTKRVLKFIDDDLIRDFDLHFTGFTPQQKEQYLQDVELAKAALLDNETNKKDFLALSKILPGFDLTQLFYTGLSPETVARQQQAVQQQAQLLEEQEEAKTPQQRFQEYVDSNYPIVEGSSAEFDIPEPKQKIDPADYEYLKTKSVNHLRGYILKYAMNPSPELAANIQDILSVLNSRGELQQYADDPDKYVIKDLIDPKTNSGFYIDKKTKKLYKAPMQDIPYYQDKMYEKFQGTDSKFDRFFTTPKKKQGGILYASDGTQVPDDPFYSSTAPSDKVKNYGETVTGIDIADGHTWTTDVWDQNKKTIAEILNNQDKEVSRRFKEFLNDMQDKHYQIYEQAATYGQPAGTKVWNGTQFVDTQGWRKKAPFSTNGWTEQYQNLYKTGWEGVDFNTLGIQNAATLGAFMMNGKRLTGDYSNNDWKTDNYYSGITDWRRLLGRIGDFTNEQVDEFNKSIEKSGFKLVSNDKTGYYYLEDVVKNTETPPVTKPTPGGGKKPPAGGGSDIYGNGGGDKKDTDNSPFETTNLGFLKTLPYGVGLNRMYESWRANEDVAEDLKRPSPQFYSTYNRFSPVTGNYAGMQNARSRGATMQFLANRPFTSNADQQMAYQLDVQRQVSDTMKQAEMEDNKEIKRTGELALDRREDNDKRWSDISNKNRELMYEKDKEDAEIDATHRKNDWKSEDNYLAEIEQGLRDFVEDKEDRLEDTSTYYAYNTYKDTVDKYNRWYKEHHPGATYSSMLVDPDYQKAIRQIQDRYQYDTYAIANGQYYKNPYADKAPLSYSDILKQIMTAHKGGQIQESPYSLIRRIIHESGT